MKITYSTQQEFLVTLSSNDGMTFVDISITPFFITKEYGNIINVCCMLDKIIPGFELIFYILGFRIFFRHNTKKSKAFFASYGIGQDT